MINTWILVVALILGGGLAGPAAASVAEAERLVEDARERLADNEVSAAIIQLRNAVLEDPENMEARRLLGELYLRTAQFEAAAEELARVLEVAPDPEIARLTATAELARGDAERALAILDAHGDDGVEVETLRAEALLALGRLEEAGEATTRALAEAPLHVAANQVEARRLAAVGEMAAARERLRTITDLAADNVGYWLLRGQLAMADIDFAAAAEAFARAEEIAPASPDVQLLQSRLAQQQGKLAEARGHLEAVLESEPDNAAAIFRLAELQLAEGDPSAADQTLRGIADLLREDPNALRLQGTIKARLGQYAQARTFLGRYLAQRPDDASARQLLAAVALEDDAPRAAADVLGDLLEDGGTQNIASLVLLSSAQLRIDDVEAARETLNRIVAAGSEHDARQARNLLDVLERTTETPLELRRDLLLAVDELRFQRPDSALAYARSAAERAPERVVTKLVLADVHAARNDIERTRAILEEVVAENPGELRALQLLIRLDLAAGNWQAVEGYLDSWLAQEPNNVTATTLLVRYLNARGRLDEARDRLEAQLEAQPGEVRFHTDLASILFLQDDRAALRELVERTAELGRDGDVRLLDVAAGIAFNLGDTERAREIVDRRLERTPDDVGALLSAARVQYVAGDVAAARATLERVRELDPANQVAANSLVDLALQENDIEGALAFTRELADQAPQLAAALESRVLFTADRPDEAVAALERLQNERPSSEGARMLFLARRQAGRQDEAIAGLRAWVQRHPVDVAALDMLSQAMIVNGDYARASLYLEQALRFVPSDPALLNNLAWLRHEQGQEGAETLARRALQLAPESPEIADTLGWILVQEGDVANGLGLLREAVRLANDNPDMRYHLAYALHANGEDAEASEVLRDLLARHEQFMRRREAEMLLAELEAR
jgi:putative PEP-CTERM system TPR-repeat lipoprotein